MGYFHALLESILCNCWKKSLKFIIAFTQDQDEDQDTTVPYSIRIEHFILYLCMAFQLLRLNVLIAWKCPNNFWAEKQTIIRDDLCSERCFYGWQVVYPYPNYSPWEQQYHPQKQIYQFTLSRSNSSNKGNFFPLFSSIFTSLFMYLCQLF